MKSSKCFRLGWVVGFFLTVLVMSCGQNPRLVVYADPWLEDYALRITAEYKRDHPEVEVKLKVISSEVVFQHLRFGQPVDVFLCFGQELLPQTELQPMIAAEARLADTRLVEVHPSGTQFQAKQEAFGSKSCRVVEASDRPLRRYAEQSFWRVASPDSCTLVANFHGQFVAYLRRGWAPSAIVPHHFLLTDSTDWKPGWIGPLIPDAFTAILLQKAPNSVEARAFFELVQSEKSRQFLGELGFLP